MSVQQRDSTKAGADQNLHQTRDASMSCQAAMAWTGERVSRR